MADKKKKTPDSAKEAESKVNNAQKAPENENLSMDEKLRAAAGNITKAHANHRARNSELVKRRIKAEKETAARIAEAEKRKAENEKAAQKVADERLAAFDYAQNYRKKLLKEREAAASAAKQRDAEAREAAMREAKEAKEQTVASFIEMERQEARERSERAEALVNSVTKREIVDEDGNKVLVDRFPNDKPTAEPEAEPTATEADEVPAEAVAADEPEIAEPAPESSDADSAVKIEVAVEPDDETVEPADEATPDAETAEDAPDAAPAPESEGVPAAEDSEPDVAAEEPAADDSDAEHDADVEDGEEGESDFEPVEAVEEADDEPEDEEPAENVEKIDDSFEMVFDDDGNLVVKNREESDEEPEPEADDDGAPKRDIPEVTDEDVKAFNDKLNKAAEKRRKERERAKGIDPDAEKTTSADDVLLQDEIISVIKAEGKRLDGSESAFKLYIKHSEDAIKSFELALREAVKSLESNRNEAEGPAIIVSILKICTKILEIRCDNLENFARLKAYKYIRNARIALHGEVDRYNEYVISYSALTGEQLTRLSTLLPDSIASGKSLAVIPSFCYKESYVEIYPDKDGNLPPDSSATVIPVAPPKSAEELLGNIELPKSKFACKAYSRKIKGAIEKLDAECKRIGELIRETKIFKKRYENELRSLDAKTPVEERSNPKYKNKVINISIKYGKKLSGIKTAKTRNAFARTRQRLFVTRLAVEKEKLKLAYTYLREVHRAGKYTQRKVAEEFFVKAMTSYNKCAEGCTKVTGIPFYTLPVSLLQRICAGEKEVNFPVVAYKRELIETVGATSRFISTAVRSDLLPNEAGYSEKSREILEKSGIFNDSLSLGDESPMTDRASAIASVMISALREGSKIVKTVDDLDDFQKKCNRAIKYFKKSLKATEKAIARAFDDDGVVIALVENLRVISNLIEVRRVAIDTAMQMKRSDIARSHSRALYKEIELYNGRAIDYMSIVGEQFSRISAATPKDLMDSASKIKVPTITYKDNYIEVFPRDPLKEMSYEKPYQRNRKERMGYTPLLMKHFRLTENRAVEMSFINSPHVFEVTVNEDPVVSWWHPTTLFGHLFVWLQPFIAWCRRIGANVEIWFIDESTVIAKGDVENKKKRNEEKRKRFERKLNKLNRKHREKLLALETVIHDSDRNTQSYQKKLYRINSRYNRKIYRLKMRWMNDCTGRTKTRLLLEQLVLERERLTGMNKVLAKYRSYGRVTFLPNVLVRYKRKFLKAITAHNKTAEELSKLLDIPFSVVSTSVIEEIIRYGNLIKFPQIICCREIIETIDNSKRTIGDKWHGYGLYTGTSGASGAPGGNSPIMSVGAMGYATDMGVPFLKADFDGMTMLGMTPGGVPLIGFGKSGEAAIPFTGTPMMLQGTDDSIVLDAGFTGANGPILGAADTNNPYSGIHSAGVDAIFTEEYEDGVKDLRSGSTTETPLDLEAKMIEERFSRSLRARSMTTVDGVVTWWKLLFSEINVRWMRALFLRERGFLRFLTPRKDAFTEVVNDMVTARDTLELSNIARLGAIIDIECQRLYSATKAGIRRSQRVWSRWLHNDIEKYNNMVSEFNTRSSPARASKRSGNPPPRLRNEWLEPLSLSIPDRIIHRLDDRPPTPRVLSLRNKVEIDEHSHPITTGGLYKALYDYATNNGSRVRPLLSLFHALHMKGAAMWIASTIISSRARRNNARRFDNEIRYYRIRYEKARAMNRFNKRNIKAIGMANDPIKYQSKVFENLRAYVSTNFRIDYNMRIRQLIYRALRVDYEIYWIVTVAFCTVIALMSLLVVPAPVTQVLVIMGLLWVLLPIIFLAIKLVYSLILLIVSFVLLCTRNIWLILYGARDVERNRYGIVLACFTAEQYKVLSAAERLHRKPKSKKCRRKLLSLINDYNKKVEKYSGILRIPITEIEPTTLIEKLTSSDSGREITELQNFIYVRELVERNKEYEIDDLTRKRELDTMLASLQGELNAIINEINAQTPVGSPDVTFLQTSVQKLIGFIQSGATPTENERFELKRDLIGAINRFDLTENQIELFAKDVIKLVDSLGKKPKRRIISVLAVDDMIDLKTKK